jgi:hypothetical protein
MVSIDTDINLYKDLVKFCNDHGTEIETRFQRLLVFNDFHAECYEKMFYKNRHPVAPPAVKELKKVIPQLSDAYIKASSYYLNQRTRYKKGYDIQLGQWYEKALKLFLATKGLKIKKKGFPYPDLQITDDRGVVLAYFELKFIEAPFLMADKKIKKTYPYSTKRYDYEASLTLDTGEKMLKQREKMEELEKKGYPVHFLWWFDCFHVKGIFAMASHEVYGFYDCVGNQHERKLRDGDLEDHQEIGKIYPPLLEMTTFAEYLDQFGVI